MFDKTLPIAERQRLILNQRLEEIGISKTALGRKIGVESRATVNAWFNRQTLPKRRETLQKLLTVMGLDIAAFDQGIYQKRDTTAPTESVTDSTVEEVYPRGYLSIEVIEAIVYPSYLANALASAEKSLNIERIRISMANLKNTPQDAVGVYRAPESLGGPFQAGTMFLIDRTVKTLIATNITLAYVRENGEGGGVAYLGHFKHILGDKIEFTNFREERHTFEKHEVEVVGAVFDIHLAVTVHR